MFEGGGVVLLVLEGPPKREMQVRLVFIVAAFPLEKGLHGDDFGVREYVVFQIRQAPVRLTHARIHLQALLVRLFALETAAESLVEVPDRKPQPDFGGIHPRCLLKSR